jgi:hypothetical protein
MFDLPQTSSEGKYVTLFRLPALSAVNNLHKSADVVIAEHISYISAREYEEKV